MASRLGSAVNNYRRYGQFGTPQKPAGPERIGRLLPPKLTGPDFGHPPGVMDTWNQAAQTTYNPNWKPPPITQPAPTPAPAPAAEGPVRPFSAAYDSALARIRARQQQLEAGYKFDEQGISQIFGLDAKGQEITDVNNALYNPFNRMAMLRQSLSEANNATTGNLAAQGQLYSGYTQGALDENRTGFAQSEDELKRAHAGARQQLLNEFLQAQQQLMLEEEGAEGDYLQWLLDQGLTLDGDGNIVPIDEGEGDDGGDDGGGGGVGRGGYPAGVMDIWDEAARSTYGQPTLRGQPGPRVGVFGKKPAPKPSGGGRGRLVRAPGGSKVSGGKSGGGSKGGGGKSGGGSKPSGGKKAGSFGGKSGGKKSGKKKGKKR